MATNTKYYCRKILVVVLSCLVTLFSYKSCARIDYPNTLKLEIQSSQAIEVKGAASGQSDISDLQSISFISKSLPLGRSSVCYTLPIKTIRAVVLELVPCKECTILLKNIKLASGNKEYSFDLRKDFLYKNVQCNFLEDGSVSLSNIQTDSILVSKSRFKFRSHREVDWCIIFISFVLSILLFNYSERKISEQVRLSNTEGKGYRFGFCIILSISLFLPMSNISNEDILASEARKRAAFPRFKQNLGNLNKDFGREFDSFFSDRFFGRDWLIDLYFNLISTISGVTQNNTVISYSDNWMFWKPRVDRLNKPLSEAELEKCTENIRKLEDFCLSNKIKLYVLVCPCKETIYADRNHNMLTKHIDMVDVFFEKLRGRGYSLIYPKKELLIEAKMNPHNYLFFKTDGHATENGSFVMYESLLKELRKTFPELPIVKKQEFVTKPNKLVSFGKGLDFTVGAEAISLKKGEADGILDVSYDYYEDTLGRLEDVCVYDNMEEITRSNSGFGRAIIMGDSFTHNLASWLRYSFRDLWLIRCNNGQGGDELRMDRWEEKIKSYKPNVLIICIMSQNLPNCISTLY